MAPGQGALAEEFPQVSVVVLDSGAVTSLARRDRRRAASVHHSGGSGPPSTVVPAVVLVECLSGRQRADAAVVAMAEPGGAVLTHDTKDLRALAAHARDVTVFAA